MARPIEINRDQAFDDALVLFWQRGYRATSLQDLLDAMNIGKSSFYAAFGSKEELFISILDHYREKTQEILSDLSSRFHGLDVIQEFLNTMFLNKDSKEKRRRGCLVVNTVLELAGVDDNLHGRANKMLMHMEAEFVQALGQAEKLGQLPIGQTPKDLASLLMLVIQGLRVANRRGMSRAQAQVAVDNVMLMLKRPSNQA